MTKKQSPESPAPLDEPTTPAPPATEPHPLVSSPSVKKTSDQMKHAARPNDAEPLAHRNRGKAGRKG